MYSEISKTIFLLRSNVVAGIFYNGEKDIYEYFEKFGWKFGTKLLAYYIYVEMKTYIWVNLWYEFVVKY